MAEPTIQLGGGNWAGKSGNLLGYYEQNKKFYAEDFTFSRSTTGTYTDSEGYIQEMPYNLLQYSEDFSQWSLNTSGISSIEANYAASPKGLQNAYKVNFIVQSDSDLSLSQTHTIIGGSTYVYSIYIKGEGTNIGKDVVIKSKRHGGGDSAGTTTTQTLTNEWKRINFTTTYAANNINGRLLISSNEATSCLIYGAQAEEGTSAKTYFPTTTRLNMPRVDYLNNSNGSLILEPQSTNLVTYSEDFRSNSNFTTNAPNSIFESGYLAPDGSLTATRINGFDGYYVALSNLGSGDARSMYVKSGNGQTGNVNILDPNSQTHSLFEVTNEWKRVELVGNDTWFYIVDGRGASLTLDDVIVWGLQQENLSYATSIINTSGSSVTRNADTCSITDVADRIGQTEGVLYAEIAKADITATEGGVYLSKDANNEIRLNFATGNRLNVFVNVGGSNQVYMDNTSYNLTDYHKIAIKYKLNDYAVYVDGSEIYTDTSANVPTGLNTINFNSFYGKVKDLKVYNTALLDTELATLTTL